MTRKTYLILLSATALIAAVAFIPRYEAPAPVLTKNALEKVEAIPTRAAPTIRGEHKKPYAHTPTPKLPTSEVHLADRLNDLEREAKTGDPDIGYALALELMECRRLADQYAEADADLSAHPERAEAIEARTNALDKRREYCRGLSDEQMRGFDDWIELAARRGSVAAEIAYPTLAGLLLSSPDHALDTAWINNYKTNSLAFLQAAAESGSVDALSQLAFTYSDGYMVPKDMTTAYAYEYAVSQTGLTSSSSKVLELWSAEMTPEQIESARKLGQSIYSRCCT